MPVVQSKSEVYIRVTRIFWLCSTLGLLSFAGCAPGLASAPSVAAKPPTATRAKVAAPVRSSALELNSIVQPRVGTSGANITREFVLKGKGKCVIASDVRTCGTPPTEIILFGAPDSSDFLLTFSGVLQMQTGGGMRGNEKLRAILKSGTKSDNLRILVHHFRPGLKEYGVDETVYVKGSRFALKDVDGIRLELEKN